LKDQPQKIRALIIDDELHARENLRFLIEDCAPEIEVVGTADGVRSALDAFHKLKPDLLFLDIRMPSGSEGFDLLEALKDERFLVIFVTAFKDYAIRAFERRALHYILKPIDEGDLQESVKRIMAIREIDAPTGQSQDLKDLKEEVEQNIEPKRITINHSKGVRVVELDEIEHLQSSGNCTIIHFKNNEQFLDTRTMKVYETILPSYFHRIHRSFIINLKEVTEILHGDSQEVVLKSGKHVSFARDKKRDLVEAIKKLP
jgi:two-component system LytT family response regulator